MNEVTGKGVTDFGGIFLDMKIFGIGFGEYRLELTVYLGNRSLDIFIWSALKRPTYVYHNKESFNFEVEHNFHPKQFFVGFIIKKKN